MMEIILLIKRQEIDTTWQASPYQLKDEAHAERIVDWLKNGVMKNTPFEYKIIKD